MRKYAHNDPKIWYGPNPWKKNEYFKLGQNQFNRIEDIAKTNVSDVTESMTESVKNNIPTVVTTGV